MARCRGIKVHLGASKYIVNVCTVYAQGGGWYAHCGGGQVQGVGGYAQGGWVGRNREGAHRYRVEVVRYPVGEGKYMVEAVR